jgi:ABC-2 type transport system permease protein
MFYKNFMDQIRQTKRNIMLFLIPVLIFTFIYFYFSTNEVEMEFIEPINIGLVIEEESPYVDMLAGSYLENEDFNELVHLTYGTKEAVTAAFYNNELDAMVEVPAGYVNSVMYFEYSPIIVKVNYNDPFNAVLIKSFMLSYEEYLTGVEASVKLLFETLETQDFEPAQLYSYNESFVINLALTAFARKDFFEHNAIVDIPSVVSMTYYFIAILVMFIMYISVFSAISLIRERETNCFTRLKISKLSIHGYIFSKALSTTVFILLIVVCWYLVFSIASGGQLDGSIFRMLMLLSVIILFDIAFVMGVSAFIEREDGVVLLCDVIIFINSIIGGSIIPIHYIPDSLQKISILSPVYWMIRGLLYYESGYNITDGNRITLLLLGMAIILLMMTGFRYNQKAKYD